MNSKFFLFTFRHDVIRCIVFTFWITLSTFSTLRRLIMFEIIFQLKVTTSNNILVILQFSFLLPLSRTFRHPGEWEYAAPAYQLKCFHWGFLQFTRITTKKRRCFYFAYFLWEEILWKRILISYYILGPGFNGGSIKTSFTPGLKRKICLVIHKTLLCGPNN